MDDHEERQGESSHMLTTAYALLQKFLVKLPIPIELGFPVIDETSYFDGNQAINAVLHAYGVIPDLPGLHVVGMKMLRHMLLDWVVGAYFTVSDGIRPEAWKLDVVEGCLRRMISTAEVVDDLLELGVIETLEEDDDEPDNEE